MLYVLTHKAEKQLSNCNDSHRFGPLSCEKFKLSTTTCSSVVPAPLGDPSVLKHCAASLVRVKLTQFIQVMIYASGLAVPQRGLRGIQRH